MKNKTSFLAHQPAFIFKKTVVDYKYCHRLYLLQ